MNRVLFNTKHYNVSCMDRFKDTVSLIRIKKIIYLVGDSHVGSLANTAS